MNNNVAGAVYIRARIQPHIPGAAAGASSAKIEFPAGAQAAALGVGKKEPSDKKLWRGGERFPVQRQGLLKARSALILIRLGEKDALDGGESRRPLCCCYSYTGWGPRGRG